MIPSHPLPSVAGGKGEGGLGGEGGEGGGGAGQLLEAQESES